MQSNPKRSQPNFGERLNTIAENILFVLFTVMVFVVFVNVVARYIFNSSIIESEEIARYSFVWASLLGAVLALNENEHIGVDLVVRKLPASLRKFVLVFANLCILFFTGICTWYGYVLAESTFGWPSPATRIPYGIIGLIIPISFLAMFIIVIRKTIGLLRSEK